MHDMVADQEFGGGADAGAKVSGFSLPRTVYGTNVVDDFTREHRALSREAHQARCQLVVDKEEELTRGVSAARWTFIIGKDGKIAYKNTMVKAAEDSKAVLEAVEKLK